MEQGMYSQALVVFAELPNKYVLRSSLPTRFRNGHRNAWGTVVL